MPLEIRELIIRVTVNENSNSNALVLPEEKMLEWKNKVIKECMEKLLVKIDRLNDR